MPQPPTAPTLEPTFPYGHPLHVTDTNAGYRYGYLAAYGPIPDPDPDRRADDRLHKLLVPLSGERDIQKLTQQIYVAVLTLVYGDPEREYGSGDKYRTRSSEPSSRASWFVGTVAGALAAFTEMRAAQNVEPAFWDRYTE